MDDTENTNDIPREKDNGNPAPPPFTELQSILPDSEPEKAREAPEPTEKRLREWIQLGVNAFLALVGCFAVCIYYGQLQVSKRSLAEIEKQLPEMQKNRLRLRMDSWASKLKPCKWIKEIGSDSLAFLKSTERPHWDSK